MSRSSWRDGLAHSRELALGVGVSTLGAEMRTLIASGHFRQVAEPLCASVPFSPRPRDIFFMGLPWLPNYGRGEWWGNCSQSAVSLSALWPWSGG